jgi:hypothetical protein
MLFVQVIVQSPPSTAAEAMQRPAQHKGQRSHVPHATADVAHPHEQPSASVAAASDVLQHQIEPTPLHSKQTKRSGCAAATASDSQGGHNRACANTSSPASCSKARAGPVLQWPKPRRAAQQAQSCSNTQQPAANPDVKDVGASHGPQDSQSLPSGNSNESQPGDGQPSTEQQALQPARSTGCERKVRAESASLSSSSCVQHTAVYTPVQADLVSKAGQQVAQSVALACAQSADIRLVQPSGTANLPAERSASQPQQRARSPSKHVASHSPNRTDAAGLANGTAQPTAALQISDTAKLAHADSNAELDTITAKATTLQQAASTQQAATTQKDPAQNAVSSHLDVAAAAQALSVRQLAQAALQKIVQAASRHTTAW